jgi:hypothetical protein
MASSPPEPPASDIPDRLPTKEHRVAKAPAAPAPMAIPLPPVQVPAEAAQAEAPPDRHEGRRPSGWRRWSVLATAIVGGALLLVVFSLLTLDSPRLAPLRDVVVKTGQTARTRAELEEPDKWAGGVYFSLGEDAPFGATIDANTGEFSWSPTVEQGGRVHRIAVRVARSTANRSPHEQSLQVQVNANFPPHLESPSDRVAKVGEQVAFRVRGRDTDEPPSRLRYSLVGEHNPPGATLEPASGEFWWPVGTRDAGQTYRIAVEAVEQDGEALRANASSIIRVHPRMPVGYGLTAQYFADHEWTQQVVERFDRQVDFLWCSAAPHPDLTGDDFAVRWTGWIRPPAAGEYRIVAVSDDGVRVSIDDKTLIDDWSIGPLRRREAAVKLSSKPHSLRVEYREHKEAAIVSLRWIRPGNANVEEVIPPQCLFCVQETGEQAEVKLPAGRALRNLGLTAEYFSGTNFERAIERRVEPLIDHFWGLDKPLARLPADLYSVRWTGRLTPILAGKYKLVTYSDDGVRVWIDDKPVIDHWKRHVATRDEAEVELAAQPHKIRVEYFDDDHAALVSLRWILPGDVEEAVIPTWAFSHE